MENTNLQLASRWKRLGGALIDGVIMMVITLPIMLVIGIFPSAGEPMTFGKTITASIIGIAVFLGLNGYFLAKQGQTIGKMAVKTRIVDLNGNLCPFGKLIALRYLILWVISWIPFIGNIYGLVDVLFIFGKEKRCVHDYIAGTIVIDA